jgi:hypothetical protein
LSFELWDGELEGDFLCFDLKERGSVDDDVLAVAKRDLKAFELPEVYAAAEEEVVVAELSSPMVMLTSIVSSGGSGGFDASEGFLLVLSFLLLLLLACELEALKEFKF